jgi:hypothetical protein
MTLWSFVVSSDVPIALNLRGTGIDQTVTLLASLEATFRSLWQMYATVTFATIGFVTTARNYLDWKRGAIVAFTFGLFAVFDLRGLVESLWQWSAVYQGAIAAFCNGMAADQCGLAPFEPTHAQGLAIFHVVLDVIVIGVVILLTYDIKITAADAAKDA